MTADEALVKINAALFPALKKECDGTLTDYDAFYNLEAAIIDLRLENANQVCLRTLERVQNQILAVSRLLQEAGATGCRSESANAALVE